VQGKSALPWRDADPIVIVDALTAAITLAGGASIAMCEAGGFERAA
jgi:hypothetical protein